jgi:iron complex outermembrane recepter protein
MNSLEHVFFWKNAASTYRLQRGGEIMRSKKTNSTRPYIKDLTVALLAATSLTAAFADEPSQFVNQRLAASSAESDSGSTAIEEVIVTARRRAEDVEKVPISVEAIGGAELKSRGIVDDNDLQLSVPGLTVGAGGNSNLITYSIRGQGVDTYTNSPPSVLPYIDEAQITSPSVGQIYDLESIQVLKGPQGTLFGRNTTGGAVLYQTAKPDDQFDGYVLGRYGSFDSKHAEGAVSLPINSAIGLRLAGSYTGGGAYEYNIATGKYVGNQDKKSIRATLVLTPLPGLTNTTVVQHSWDGGENTPPVLWSAYSCGQTYNGQPLTTTAGCAYTPVNPGFSSWVALHPNIFQGGVIAYLAYIKTLGPWVTDVNVPYFHQAKSTFAINTTAYELSSNLTVKNILSYNESWSNDGFDYDGTPYPIFQIGGTPSANATTVINPQGFLQYVTQLSEEIQLQGNAFNDRLNYTTGFYYLDQLNHVHSPLYAFDFSPLAAGFAFAYGAHMYDRSEGVYMQGTYKLTDRLNATGGFRYTWDQLSSIQDPDSAFGAAHQSMTSSKPSWAVTVDYRLLNPLMAYAATRGSWRAGGYNYSVFPLNADASGGGNEFRPETTEDVEVGLKYSGDEFGVPLTLNVDIYNQWVKDVQRAAYVLGLGGTSTLLTANVPADQISGLEMALQIRPTPWLQLGAIGSYTDARFTNSSVNLLGNIVNYGPVANTPRWSGSLFAEVSHRLQDNVGVITLRGDVYAQSTMPFSNLGNTRAPFTTLPGYGLTNFKLSWRNVLGGKLTVAAYARNAFNQRYYVGGNPEGGSLGVNYVDAGTPRIFGGELRWDF